MDTSFLNRLGVESVNPGTWYGRQSASTDTKIDSNTPVDGSLIGQLTVTGESEYEQVLKQASEAFQVWRATPAPQRGEIVRQYGELLRKNKKDLGRLVSYEMGKSLQEGWGEVQEMIDICDFALGQSRMLYGMTTHSERPQHRMYEQWHPLGVVGIISAFNFPVAVWAWNAMIALVCGNVCVWKPSEKSSLCAIACQKLFNQVAEGNDLPDGLCNVIVGDYQVGEMMTSDTRIPLISATGSTAMGKKVGTKVAERLGKTILELGGNNAMIITPSANMDLVLTAGVFGAVGTAGQRCTSTRRLVIHDSIYDTVKEKLAHAYGQLKIGNPLEARNHMGPLIDEDAVRQYERALEAIKVQGGEMVVEGGRLTGPGYESGCYVKPCIAEVENDFNIVQHETFAPILYIMKYSEIEEAISMQNDVPQGLSSAIITDSLRESETFLSYKGSDCGIANVNIGTSGAEIGGAFGGEKETGGGRESGSDAWKAYMRRQTNTINWSREVPLAQGIEFDLSGE